ncbi:MAG: sigma-70 family RNA polymerase sigma factor [Clostridia bacterium]|nr:sigma-70 family RNA polymerase sigma factor [Clostridia bacterium]
MEELIKKAKNGNQEAFSDLIRNIQNDLLKIAKMRLSCEDDIQEAVQETIIEAYKSIKKLKHDQYFKTWIIKILINKCNKMYKKNQKFNQLNLNIEYDNILVNNDHNITESNMDFYFLIKNLNYNERIALILYYMEDYTTKDISKILKVSENTIKARLSRAKEKIKILYKEVV